MTDPLPTLFVCFTCGADKSVPKDARPGGVLLAGLEAVADHIPARLQRVKCLNGCDFPCAVAVAAPDKLTYVFGDIPPGPDQRAAVIQQLIDYLHAYRAAKNGFVPGAERPPLFKRVIARIPPPTWVSESGVTGEKIS
jgi:predicted metal-binding protein